MKKIYAIAIISSAIAFPAYSMEKDIAALKEVLVELLAEEAENPDLHDQTTPHVADPDLHMAIFMRSPHYVERLIRQDRRALNQRNSKGQAALEYAREIARLSLYSDADAEHMLSYVRANAHLYPAQQDATTAAAICAANKKTSDNIVKLLEKEQKEYVLKYAKAFIGHMLTQNEIRRTFFVDYDHLGERGCMDECAQAIFVLLGKTVVPAQSSVSNASEAEEKQDTQAAQADQGQEESDTSGYESGSSDEIDDEIDVDEWLAQRHRE